MYIEQVKQARHQATPQRYEVYGGDYSHLPLTVSIFPDELQESSGVTPEARDGLIEASSVEQFWDVRTDEILSQKPVRDPAVIVDLGGAAALTVLRQANKRKDDVDSGRVAYVVTNAGSTVLDFINALSGPKRSEAQDLYAAVGDKIHELKTDFMPGGTYKITLPGGKEVDLRQGVDLLHERMSLTLWGDKPKVQIPEALKLLSTRGLYMVQARDVRSLHRRTGKRTPHSKAFEAMSREGYVEVDRCEAGAFAGRISRYLMLRGPQSPLVRLDLASVER